ncbi:MAG TPA: Lrp/AsnC family transcriptional regulator [Solirubrobacteraceae bacterium]|nr:Lrp/AsnC family transcriptional regulator [Solirubrobacteraceae bacterium]
MESRGLTRGPVRRPASLDELDGRIIAALQANGRESFRAMAASFGVSEATIRNRYARLVDSGALQVTAVTNPLGMGYDAQALLGITVDGPPERVADVLATWPEAIYVVITAGRFDVLVELVSRDRRDLLELINRVRSLDGVTTTETFVYLDLVKQLFDWGAPVGEAAPT